MKERQDIARQFSKTLHGVTKDEIDISDLATMFTDILLAYSDCSTFWGNWHTTKKGNRVLTIMFKSI
jgi:hypothetical protein